MSNLNEIFNIEKYENVQINGLNDSSFSLYINNLYNKIEKNILIVTPTLFECNNLLNNLSSFNDDVLLFPMDDFLTSMAIATSPDLKITRLETINKILTSKKCIVITHLLGYLRYLPAKSLYKSKIKSLSVNNEYNIKQLINDFINSGYNKETVVSKTGDISYHGYIIDIFPVGEEHPVRLEFFGDELDSIRYFDEETQKSIQTIKSIDIYPSTEFLINEEIEEEKNQNYYKKYSNEIESISDYLNNSLTIIKDYNQIKNIYNELLNQIQEYKEEQDKEYTEQYMFGLEKLNTKNILLYNTKDTIIPEFNFDIINYKTKSIQPFHENIEAIENFISKNKEKTIIICQKKYQNSNFKKNIKFKCIETTLDNIKINTINLIDIELEEGFIYKDYIILTASELYNTQVKKKKYKTKFKYSVRIKDLNNLDIGDYVVHDTSGVGIYNGIKTLTINNLKKDFIELLYKGNDKLYIPVEKISYISKYSGKDGINPTIHGLNSIEWNKTKIRVTEKVKNIAAELLNIQAQRQLAKGIQYPEDDELQHLFEEEFLYTPTNDQINATNQIKKEMETSHPMDRLLCGDVGFGKTEVAFRAMFKAAISGYQVIYLCPTTILSIQQYKNAVERFKNYPITIKLLNRFVPTKEIKANIDGFNKGKIDILIGTHKVLNDQITPKNLGLLIIDEEQRFGVTHKEKIKKLKNNIDVLTLTATPIPRTLQLSLVGIRSLSLITTPPVNRYPVQTYVVEENKQLMKEAIYKELSRNGQVFILYNHVETIEQKVNDIQKLVPEAKIIYAHGRMEKNSIENKMLDFIEHKADIMVCTTIIETGIDIPNVNTLIVLEADRFGLSQLYQIRGRVGRSDKIAYSYMMYKRGQVLGETAYKRLKTLEEFTELGSGFKIANRDLAIRGAGNILGSEQAGFIDSVGIELYLKILNDEVSKLKGEKLESEDTLTNKALIDVETHIDNDYVDSSELKIEIHKLINTIDSIESLNKIKEEIEDRFGKIDKSIDIYMYEEYFEKLAKKLDIIKVNQTQNEIEIIFSKNKSEQLNGEKLFIDAYHISPYFKFNYKSSCLSIILPINKLDKHYIYVLIDLLKTIE